MSIMVYDTTKAGRIMGRRAFHYEHQEPKLGDTSKLSPRQREIAELIGKGYKSIDIAVELGISLNRS